MRVLEKQMTIQETAQIDFIGLNDSTGEVVLTISDHLEWNNNHLVLLQEKLNARTAKLAKSDT